jgi:hypothetical protein
LYEKIVQFFQSVAFLKISTKRLFFNGFQSHGGHLGRIACGLRPAGGA